MTQTQHIPPISTLNAGGTLLDLSTPLVMGIVNITPDSFHAPSRVNQQHDIVERVREMLHQGADIIDVGAYSSRPGADDITVEEEIARLDTALSVIRENFPDCIISIDTFRSAVATYAIDRYGVNIINDISGGMADEAMISAIAHQNVAYVLMHMQGSPQTMQQHTTYVDLMNDIMLFFARQLEKLTYAGIGDIIIDPGFGFSKNTEQNFELLNRLDEFCRLGYPVLAGLSRKSMIWKTLDITPADALNGTTALNSVALLKGAKILRVHDVAEARQCITLMQQLEKR
ncbi:dihydropteroate synthase [Breznakibacter xylanolyticus]|uniref:dihydropteroate synthase n=1 Tax=Breznakibacter xylanolyticus TaxID=990 RepID=A0A2W7NSW5_9BACT|nr:dihydropteroate synthase [Breznakibacter xylanolyticus]PZX16386.1 dihydropteroate synthase [Breznakibacter xylanolyticus]